MLLLTDDLTRLSEDPFSAAALWLTREVWNAMQYFDVLRKREQMTLTQLASTFLGSEVSHRYTTNLQGLMYELRSRIQCHFANGPVKLVVTGGIPCDLLAKCLDEENLDGCFLWRRDFEMEVRTNIVTVESNGLLDGVIWLPKMG